MNERIAKLYEQAIVLEDGGDYVCGELNPVKFAELIVRECMKLNSKELSITAIERLLPLYEEHFGIEE